MKKFLVAATLILASVLALKASTDEPYGPVVVYKDSGTGITVSVANTTIWTPVSDGFYSVVGHARVTAGTCSTFSPQVTGTTPESIGVSINGVFVTGSESVRFFYAGAGQPIQFQFTIAGAGCTYNYAVELIKE